MALSSYLGERAKFSYQASDMLMPFAITLIPFVLIFLQPDLGTALMLIPILFSMLFIRGVNIKHLFSIIAAGLLSTPFLPTI